MEQVLDRYRFGTIASFALCLGLFGNSQGCSRTGLPVGDSAVSCSDGSFVLTRAIPSVVFVLDRSRSMDSAMSSSDSSSRWEALTEALSVTLPSFDQEIMSGALIFPAGESSNRCTVSDSLSLQPAAGHASALTQLMKATSPSGATPTADAIEAAGKGLAAVRASSTARALVLLTDGGPDCNTELSVASCRCASSSGQGCESAERCLDDARTVARITSLEEEGIPTYVIGIQSEDDETFADVLNAMAVAGGRPQEGAAQSYYRASSQAELNSALSTIAEQVGSCVYLTSSVPDASGQIQLYFNGDAVSSGAWSWADEENGEILLGAELCSHLNNEGDAVMSVTVSCGS